VSELEDEIRRIVRQEIKGALRASFGVSRESIRDAVSRLEETPSALGLVDRVDSVGEQLECDRPRSCVPDDRSPLAGSTGLYRVITTNERDADTGLNVERRSARLLGVTDGVPTDASISDRLVELASDALFLGVREALENGHAVVVQIPYSHESSFHVAEPEVAPSGDPATIMAGTPDTDPSQGDGASVEGPAPRSGPSTSSKRPVNDYIAHRVKWILFIRQIRDREFAAAIGVSPSTVSRLLSGERRWRAETIRSTARFLDMSADDLFPPRDWGRS